MSRPPSCPASCRQAHSYRMKILKMKPPNLQMENSASWPFWKKPTQLIKAAKPSQPPSRFRGPSCPMHCLLVLNISLVKSAWKLLWGFLFVPILGNPRTQMAGNISWAINVCFECFKALEGNTLRDYSCVNMLEGLKIWVCNEFELL